MAVPLDLLILRVHGPYELDWTDSISLIIVAAFASFLARNVLKSSLSHLPKEMKEAMVKAWLRDEGGYAEVQVRDIMAGPHREDLEPDLDLDLHLDLDLETEKLKDAITVVQGSAKPLLEKKVVGKGQISVVKGSARPWVKGRRTHSLWEAKARARTGAGIEGVEGEGQGQRDGGVDDGVDD